MIIELILDGKIKGSIDSVNQRLEIDREPALEKRRYEGLLNWTNELERMHKMIVNKLANIHNNNANFGPASRSITNNPLMTPT